MKIYIKSILIFFSVCFGYTISNAQTQNVRLDTEIIPKPLSLIKGTGQFDISSATVIYVDENNIELMRLAKLLKDQIEDLGKMSLKIQVNSKKITNDNAIVLTLVKGIDTLGLEGYHLTVAPKKITLSGYQLPGIFYGMQSVFQLIPPVQWKNNNQKLSIPAVEVVDKPRYKWRGMMLDVSRHFYSVDFIKRFIDHLALHKMNSFHWHLTDDQGWRIEIKKYPELTEIGAWRDGTMIKRADNTFEINDKRYGGYYTQAQIKDIVKYAQERFINIVPEIEMPGHAMAALATYPELSCTEKAFTVGKTWGVYDDVFCAGKEETFQFLENVLSEVIELFPSKVIHIGGDESPKIRWEHCDKCQARIKAEGLKDEHELQSYFIKRIENYLLTKNKRIIGWDEILEGGLAPNATVMSWRGVTGGIAAAKQNHEVIMSPNSHLYFDHYQGNPALEPVAIGGLNTLQRVYSYEPTPETLSKSESDYILGAQANLWTEYIYDEAKVEYMLMPRLAALSEVVWTQKNLKDWESFKQRMDYQYKRYNALGINYSKSAFNVTPTIIADSTQKKVLISLETQAYNPKIYYTLNGLEPTTKDKRYTKPFEVADPVTLKTIAYYPDGTASKVDIQKIEIPK
ncbi:family 20 glycosylhydrolase [Pedobacter sp. Du54]|uniref:beta-N-acetylhexosaminidase n=1 Tax=Pedobacter anseongensis TaxID=3133439 RepID=UPI0030AE892D